MKKILAVLTLIVIALFIAPFSYVVNADENLEINTFYPNDVMGYANLSNISNVTINDNYIAYTTNNTISIFNKNDKSIKQITNISSLLKIKFCYDKLLVAGDNTISIIDPATLNVTPISSINYPDNAPINFYFNNTTAQIGIIDTYLYIHTFDISNNELVLSSHSSKNITLHTSEHTPYALSINNNKCHILSMNNEDYSPNPTHLCVINTVTGETIEENGFKKATFIETFVLNDVEYIATFVSDSNLFILDNSLNELAKISVSHESESNSTITIINKDNSTKVVNSSFPIYTIKSLELYQNQLILCDISYKTICSFNVSVTSDGVLDITSDKVLISSNSSDIGRFNNISNIFTQDGKIYVADTDNNRLQILDRLTTTIYKTSNTISPNNLVVDKFGKIFYISSSNQNILNSVEMSDSQYVENYVSEYNSTTLGQIIQLVIDNNDKLYLLDKDNSSIHTFNTNLEYIKSLTLTTDSIDNNAQLAFVKDINKLVLYSKDKLYLVDLDDFNKSPSIDLVGYNKISAGLSSIYALSKDNSKIQLITIKDNTFVIEDEINNSKFSLYKTITLDNTTNTMYSFNEERQCIEYFSLTQEKQLPSNEDILADTPLNENTQPIALQTKSKNAIYEYPYNLGKCYNLNSEINCIGIGIVDNYYKVLISKDNTLISAYIDVNEVNKIDSIIDEKSVIVTHNSIPVYKYPTLMEFNGQTLTVDNLNRNEIITLTSHFPISIDDKDFYLYINNNTYGYIFSADVVLNTGNHITYLHNENAKVKSFDNSKINVFNDDYTTIISTLDNDYRIYVGDYDKNSKYTKVIFKDKDLKEIEGYILTEYIDMDKLDMSQIILIIIIALSIVILLGIVISYIVIKKKK